MEQRVVTGPPSSARGRLARRGMLAGVAVALGGLLSRAGERVARAAGNGAALTMGNNDDTTNAPSLETRLAMSGGANFSTAFHVTTNAQSGGAVRGESGPGSLGAGVTGVATASQSFGVVALASNSGVGVHATSGSGGNLSLGVATGVNGYAFQTTNGIGVFGNAQSPVAPAAARPAGLIGVAGTAATGIGVNGISDSSSAVLGQSNTGTGVYGASNANVGVLGSSTGSHALYGASVNGYGVYATSTNSTGVVASTNSGNAVQGASNSNVGVLGTSNSSIGGYFSSGSSTGLYATGPAAGFAARFDGPVQVNGAFTVLGGPKSAAVPHPDGTHRRLYCVESPESWFEDFGRDQLVNGRARVRLDDDFNVLVRGDNYHVFLTEHGDQGGLYVENVGPNGFTVRARNTAANGPFNYRVVAKRKDIPAQRLEKVDIQAAPPRPAAPSAPLALPAMPQPLDTNGVPRITVPDGRGR